ncbi:hypothetical protein N7520_006611 [Penicillium odoratum]|uniref:uncharacterized protein n=1 Tax=Penicillium odoratum TaxID=1167516 RepID=UPI002546D992|nr:uncharacterized protein N7520_006611 [Penicillium odoratum]KAJ5759455.1 hypothetical protein N7520_006611 [Penicillium odoratum]
MSPGYFQMLPESALDSLRAFLRSAQGMKSADWEIYLKYYPKNSLDHTQTELLRKGISQLGGKIHSHDYRGPMMCSRPVVFLRFFKCLQHCFP